MLKAAEFDSFSSVCPFFTNTPWVNNGYGCTHPKQEERRNDSEGNEGGYCYCWSCPLGIEAEQEDLESPNIDWDGLCEDGEVSESEYLLVNVGADTSEDEKSAWDSYERYIHRYDPNWKNNKGSNAVSDPYKDKEYC